MMILLYVLLCCMPLSINASFVEKEMISDNTSHNICYPANRNYQWSCGGICSSSLVGICCHVKKNKKRKTLHNVNRPIIIMRPKKIVEELVEIKSSQFFLDGIEDIMSRSREDGTTIYFQNRDDKNMYKELNSYCYECTPIKKNK